MLLNDGTLYSDDGDSDRQHTALGRGSALRDVRPRHGRTPTGINRTLMFTALMKHLLNRAFIAEYEITSLKFQRDIGLCAVLG